MTREELLELWGTHGHLVTVNAGCTEMLYFAREDDTVRVGDEIYLGDQPYILQDIFAEDSVALLRAVECRVVPLDRWPGVQVVPAPKQIRKRSYTKRAK